MVEHVCPWWGGYFIDNRFRLWLHNPQRILSPYVRPGMKALDFGCGMGFTTIGLAELVGPEGSVIAVDLQQQMLDVLAQRAQKAAVVDRIRTHKCEANSLGVKEEVDFILTFYSAHEVPDQQRLLQELAQSLHSGGQLLIVEPIGHVRKSTFAKTISVAEQEGLRIDSQPRVRLSHTALFTKE